MSPDKREISTNMSVATQIEIPRDKRGRIRWAVLKQDPIKLATAIETEAHSLIVQGVQLKAKDLIQAGFSSLSTAIVKYYPGAYFGLRQTLDLQVGTKPKNYWTRPEAIETMQQEIRMIYQQEGRVSIGVLNTKKRSDLVNAVRVHYPGGWRQCMEDMGIISKVKPHGYWIPDSIRKEAEEFYLQYGGLSQALLQQAGRDDLKTASSKKYPGGLAALKKELGVEVHSKAQGYWTIETICAEAVEFYAQFGSLTSDALRQHNTDLLAAAVNKYPGGIRQLQKDQGVVTKRKDVGYWTEEKLREEALAFYHQYGELTDTLLAKNDRADLANAIRTYPGKLRQLQEDLGAESNKKPNGYWTPENTEKEAMEFFNAHGSLKTAAIRGQKDFRLMNAISHYPGGLIGLQEKLGIGVRDEEAISADEANEQLRKLLEEQV